MKKPISVLIPDGESLFALFTAHCLAEVPDIKLYVLAGKRWASVRFSRYCHHFTYRKTWGDAKLWLDVVSELVRKHRIDVLLPTDTPAISLTIANRERLSQLVAVSPLPDRNSFEATNNKWLFSQYLKENGFPLPSTVLVSYDDRFERGIGNIRFPVLLKPTVARDGDGIEFFADEDALRRHLEDKDPEKIKNQFVVQEFLEGTVFGVNVLAKNGKLLAISAHRGLIPNTKRFAAAGATVMVRDEKIFSMITRLVSALGWSGVANLDTLDDRQDGQLKILELNPRFWASLRNPMGAGVNFAYMACLTALDESFTVPEYDGVRYFHSKTALNEAFRGLLGKGRVQGMTFQETGLRYLIKDPIAELLRAFDQEVLERESTVQPSLFFSKDQK